MNHTFKAGFRVDAGNLVGTGHLMEVIALIKSIKKRIQFTPVIITKDNQFTVEKLKQIGIDPIQYISDGISEKNEAEVILTILKKENCSHLVIDLLDYSIEYYNYLNNNLRSVCVILDNGEHKEIPATVVVNFSIIQNSKFYQERGKSKTRYLIGPEYFPINDSIKEKAGPIKIKERIERIFINQGGGDPYGLTAKIIKALEKINLEQAVDVVVGGALTPRHRGEMEMIRRNLNGRYNFYTNISQEEVYTLMERADLALTAAGNTLYELACFGVPSIVISHHERHYEVAKAFESYGAVLNLGIGVNIKEVDISNAIAKIIRDKELRNLLSVNIKKLINGDGINRIADMLIRLWSESDAGVRGI